MKRASLFLFGVTAIVVTTLSPGAAATPAGGRVFALQPQNGSGERGTFALKPHPGRTTIEIHLLGAPRGVPQPAHLHLGTCANLHPAPLVPLTPVLDGISETSVAMPMDAILHRGLALNVHESAKRIATYVACGDIAP